MNLSGNKRICITLSGFKSLMAIGSVMLLVQLFLLTATAFATDQNIDVKALEKQLLKIITPRDSIIIAQENGDTLIDINADQMLIPASILKVLTSLAATDILGEDYRYKTEFYISPEGDLSIKGYGDPLLISEKIEFIARQIALRIRSINNIVLDSSYFVQPVQIPGRYNTAEPYDAPNGALIVNFNTVSFKRVNNEWLSAEPQTPLLPVVIPKIEASGLLSGRITMAYDNDEGMMYAGELFRYFFEQEGISVNGGIKFNRVIYEKNKPLYNYINESSLSSLIRDLLEYSNNFIANQILLTMGAMKFGAPATLDKGVRTLKEYCEQQLGLKAVHIEEGSGLSRGNRITAREMLTVLEHFRKYSHLMRHKGRQYYKTGTLKGVSSRAGYLDSRSAGQYRFVVIRNTNGKTTHEIMKVIEQYLP